MLKVLCDEVGCILLIQTQNTGGGAGLWRKGMSVISEHEAFEVPMRQSSKDGQVLGRLIYIDLGSWSRKKGQ